MSLDSPKNFEAYRKWARASNATNEPGREQALLTTSLIAVAGNVGVHVGALSGKRPPRAGRLSRGCQGIVGGRGRGVAEGVSGACRGLVGHCRGLVGRGASGTSCRASVRRPFFHNVSHFHRFFALCAPPPPAQVFGPPSPGPTKPPDNGLTTPGPVSPKSSEATWLSIYPGSGPVRGRLSRFANSAKNRSLFSDNVENRRTTATHPNAVRALNLHFNKCIKFTLNCIKLTHALLPEPETFQIQACPAASA